MANIYGQGSAACPAAEVVPLHDFIGELIKEQPLLWRHNFVTADNLDYKLSSHGTTAK